MADKSRTPHLRFLHRSRRSARDHCCQAAHQLQTHRRDVTILPFTRSFTDGPHGSICSLGPSVAWESCCNQSGSKHGQIPMFLRSGNGQYHKEQAQGRGKNGGSNRITCPFRVDEERREPYLEPCLILPSFSLVPNNVDHTAARVAGTSNQKNIVLEQRILQKEKPLCPTVTKSIEVSVPKLKGEGGEESAPTTKFDSE